MKVPWREAVETFLKDWPSKPELIGALVCGSYVTGNPTSYSDIDLHLVLSGENEWRERGNVYIEGYLIEYFVNPVQQIRQYFREDYKENRSMAATQFVTGEILYDQDGLVEQLQEDAQKWLKKPFQALSKASIELTKYGLWDQWENLQEAEENKNGELLFLFPHFLYQLTVFYTKYLKYPIPAVHQLALLWEPDRAYQKYRQPAFPDAEFAKLLKQTILNTTHHLYCERAKILYQDVMKKTGGFNIDGWKFRSPVSDDQ